MARRKKGRRHEPKCRWIEDEFDGQWQTDCGHTYEFTSGTPRDNDAKFCCYCGKVLDEWPAKS